MSKDPRVYLAHILECIQKIERFTERGRERLPAYWQGGEERDLETALLSHLQEPLLELGVIFARTAFIGDHLIFIL